MTINFDGIPYGFVPHQFLMNPSEEDVIRGKLLMNGMVVLIEGAGNREDPNRSSESVSEWELERLDTTARWCKVTDLQFRDELVSFVGVYSDGIKHSRTYNISYFWYVKIASM